MNIKTLKIIFFGTPEFAAGILAALIKNKFNVEAVVTQSDKKVGRRRKITFSPVKKMAIENGVEVFQPENLRDSGLIGEIRKREADLFVVAAYGKILPRELLEIPKLGAINVHASLLPKYRGASPVQCAILAGEKETGVTLILMNEKMDEGDILAQEKIKISKDETAGKLQKKLGKLGAKMITKYIPGWIEGKIVPAPQNSEKVTYCKPIRRDDGKIDWNSAACEINRKWRAYHPWPGIFSLYKTKNQIKRLKLIEVKAVSNFESGEKPGKIIKYKKFIAVRAGKGLLILKRVQLEGKKEMDINEFVRGYNEFIGNDLM